MQNQNGKDLEERILFIAGAHTGYVRDDGGVIWTELSFAIYRKPLKIHLAKWKRFPSETDIFNMENCIDKYEQYITGAKKLNPHPKASTPDSNGDALTVEYLNNNGKSLKYFFSKFFSSVKQHLLPYSYQVYGFGVRRDLEGLEYSSQIFFKTETNDMYKMNAEIFPRLKNHCWDHSSGLDHNISLYYPNFPIDPRKRHNSTYDIYLYVLVYLKEESNILNPTVQNDQKEKRTDYCDEWKDSPGGETLMHKRKSFSSNSDSDNSNDPFLTFNNENINNDSIYTTNKTNTTTTIAKQTEMRTIIENSSKTPLKLNSPTNSSNNKTNTLNGSIMKAEKKNEIKTKTENRSKTPPTTNSSSSFSSTISNSSKNKIMNSNDICVEILESIAADRKQTEEFILYNPLIKKMLLEFFQKTIVEELRSEKERS